MSLTPNPREVKVQGENHVSNIMSDKKHVDKIYKMTGGGAGAVYQSNAYPRRITTAAQAPLSGELSIHSYASGKLIVDHRPGRKKLMRSPSRSTVDSECARQCHVSVPEHRLRNGSNYSMQPCIEFSVEHNNKLHLTLFNLERTSVDD